jgi:hypothetical protein
MQDDAQQPMFLPNSAVVDLDTAKLLTITTLRLWAAPHREPHKDHPYWKSGLNAAGLEPFGVNGFDTLMWIALAAGRRQLDIRCLNCPALGTDEAWMLQMVNHSQFGLYQEAANILGLWMIGPAVRAGVVHLNLFARSLSDAGLIVELPTGGARVLPTQTMSAAHSGVVH